MAEVSYLTKKGFEKIKAELEILRTTGRQEAARAIGEAREKGDLSENAEYEAAKDAQGMLEAKINELEKVLFNVRILDESQIDNSKVGILTKVRIRNKKTGKDMAYILVPESEADLKSGKISVGSPIGQGLLGKIPGEVAVVKTPAGLIELEILDIEISV
jgi:transcription elongation factor GreA